MKKILYIMMFSLLFSGCKDSFLDEKPTAFLNSENAYTDYAGFNATVTNIYALLRRDHFSSDELRPFDYIFGTDLVFDGQPAQERHTNMVGAYNVVGAIPLIHYQNMYKIVSEANIVITRAPTVAALTAAQRSEVVGQALFFRAYAYRTLAYMYGGVPLVLEELKAPKTDLVRATRDEVYAQCIADLTQAAQMLQGINLVANGRVSNVAANHLLAEVCVAAKRFTEAVTAATKVISDPNMGLMRTRFGSRSTQPGDVYWDLFRERNQNRASGNRESIWVMQFETDVLGGGAVSTGRTDSYMLERQHVPGFGISISGVAPFIVPSDVTGGRGIGWAIPTRYAVNQVFFGNFTVDMRNSNYNVVRSSIANNPASPRFGTAISTEAPPAGVTVFSRVFYPYYSKATSVQHPTALYTNAATGALSANAGATYVDQYMSRLAETYLIRAEAYLGLTDLVNAAADINVVRGRANASAVLPANVNIDYILDERLRELGIEEKRRLTLMRLGLLSDRVKRFNPYYAAEMLDKYNLWPIPAAEIERNKDAELKQNPDY
ncbi:RagB/SusD family nutrient uptake outer membrane protein [Pedobacter frigiditerrae]|uniref:RagB/SusD family nutrient uptake outer membrane protein n=1 Tax=Pedobacter frigiditerrae TaxID=2530452 RepID=UPI00292F795F|nr:RagB/SusD family nutrient uptake outer membrane protein [Pedobacter frigiditerrae]